MDEKNKIQITVAGKVYDLALRHKAIEIAEDKMGIGIMGIVTNIHGSKVFKVSHLWQIIWACIVVQDNAMTYEKFMDELEEKSVPIPKLTKLVTNLIRNTFPLSEKKEETGDGESSQKN